MMTIGQIKEYFPEYIRENTNLLKYMYKEYIQVLILDYISSVKWSAKLEFIGGTNLRLLKGIDRFSEDLDFDCKEFSFEDFSELSDDIFRYLNRYGFKAEKKDKENPKLNAFRANLYFPELLYNTGLSKHRDERFLIKLKCQDQKYSYTPKQAKIKRFGFYFGIREPGDAILCSMKISALLTRSKGRDFYDVMFMLGRTQPDFDFLNYKSGIKNMRELKNELLIVYDNVNMNNKSKDFEHLVFDKRNCRKILSFKDFVKEMK